MLPPFWINRCLLSAYCLVASTVFWGVGKTNVLMECVLKLSTKDDSKEAWSPGHFAVLYRVQPNDFKAYWLDLCTCLV